MSHLGPPTHRPHLHFVHARRKPVAVPWSANGSRPKVAASQYALPPIHLSGNLTLRFADDDAGAADLARGAAAALHILRAHGVTPAEANHGRWRRDLCEALGLAADPHILSHADALAALAWDEAARAGRLAAGITDDAAMRLVEAHSSLSPLPSSMTVETGT